MGLYDDLGSRGASGDSEGEEGNNGEGEEAPYRDEQRLREEYLRKGRSTRELGAEWGVSHVTVKKWLDEHGIETRGPGAKPANGGEP